MNVSALETKLPGRDNCRDHMEEEALSPPATASVAAAYKAHVLVLPFHGQGHMNPMLQFSKRLASKGVKVTVAVTLSAAKTMPPPPQIGSNFISIETVYDDIAEGGFSATGGFDGFMERYRSSASSNLKEIMMKNQSDSINNRIGCLVYDGNLPWALDVAKEFGILGAAFFTQSCASIASYLEMATQKEEKPLPELGLSKLGPLGVVSTGRFPFILNLIFTQFSNLDKVDWVLFNSFNHLEHQVVRDLLKLYPIRTIGPTIPSAYLDKRLQNDTDYGFNLFQSTGNTCLNWLNQKNKGSVVYVSFGSAARLDAKQMEELAWGLMKSDAYFLWVVRASEEDKLPFTFKEEMIEKGLLVTWCPQLEVLSHEAVGCFVTHCGWNSTVEGVSLGVPMVAMPQFLDQFSDAKFVEEVWEVGLRAKSDDEQRGLVNRDEIARCVNEVMSGEKFRRNALKWKELANEAVDDGGSSDKNIDEIIARLVSS